MGFLAHFGRLVTRAAECKKNARFLDGEYRQWEGGEDMTAKEQFLPPRRRAQPIPLPQEFSDEEMARDWTLSAGDRKELGTYRTTFRLFLAVQLCAVRLYGRFLNSVHDLSPRILNYLGSQLGLPPSLTIEVPERKATYTEHRKNLLDYLGFQKFDERGQSQLTTWLK
jgi:hypothetical protein